MCLMEGKLTRFTICLSTISLLLTKGAVDSLVCYSCSHGPASSFCENETTVQCPSGHACFNRFTTTGMGGSGNHGCTKISNCNDIRYGDNYWHDHNTLNIVGRDIVRNKRVYAYCFQCCYYNKCNNQFCLPMKTPGSWGSWTSWSSCDVTCGSGTKSRHRACNSPPPSDPRLYCAGNNTETKPCQEKLCPDSLVCYSCGHGPASSFCENETTVQCPSGHACFNHFTTTGMGGSGNHGCTKISNCNDIRYGDLYWHDHNTLDIVGRDIVRNKRVYAYCFQCCYYNKCNNQFCLPMKTPGSWGSWTSWSSCDVTCGSGTKSRHRACNSPLPSDPRLYCDGNNTETKPCQEKLCQDSLVCYSCEHGPASSLCENGTTVQCPSGHACFNQFATTGMGGSGSHGCTKISNCNDIRYGDHYWHEHNTLNIVGRDIVRNKRVYAYCFQCCYYNKCNNQFCWQMKTPGSWGTWTSWSSCDVTCGSGTQSRHRECDSPRPSDPRLYCAGNNKETKSCQKNLCKGMLN